jgi:hypothetical protein
MRLLRAQPPLIPVDKLTQSLGDEVDFGGSTDLQGYYQSSLVEQEKVEKELKILRGITKQKALLSKEELLELKVCHAIPVNEYTLCSACLKKIGTYPFCYEYSSKRLFHQFCYEPLQTNVQE